MIEEAIYGSGNGSIKLFVGSVPASASEEAIKKYFSRFGQILRVLMFYEKETGAHKKLNRGYCHLVVAHQSTANYILEEPTHIFLGREIRVSIFRRGAFLKKENAQNNSRRIIVKNIPWGIIIDDEIESVFLEFGEIQKAYIFKNSHTDSIGAAHSGYPKTRTASIMFFTQDSAERALRRSQIMFKGVFLYIEQYKHKATKNNVNTKPSSPHAILLDNIVLRSKSSQEGLATVTSLTNWSTKNQQQYNRGNYIQTNQRIDNSELTIPVSIFNELPKCHIKPTSRSYLPLSRISKYHAQPGNLCFHVRMTTVR